MKHIKITPISIKNHPTLDERWVQEVIAADPGILGLGEVVLRDRERSQPGGGRLDLLLQDVETKARYEVEVQLGATDPSHIIRTIEYWDLERKRYPSYEHTAVIVAEEITSRFLNVIGLFNGTIPLMAVKMTAVQAEGGISLLFTRVLDTVTPGLEDEDEEVNEPADRAYWDAKAPAAMVKLADRVHGICAGFSQNLELSYNRHYIGFRNEGRPCNFIVCFPKKAFMRMEVRLPKADDLDATIQADGLDAFIDYNPRYQFYRLRVTEPLLAKHEAFLRDLFKRAYDRRNAE